jgi:hypothetical protein
VTISIVGNGWWFLNGHLFIEGETHNRRGDVRWMQWRCIFCKKTDYAV